MREPSTLLLYLTGIILVLRAPYALRTKASRPGWLAGTFGLLAVICLGFVIPIPELDAVLGSAGYWNILGSTSAILSFHFMYQAILIHTSREAARFYYPGLMLAIACCSACFALIDDKQERFVSVEGFIATLIDQPWTALYLSIYLGSVGIISLLSLYAVWQTAPRSKVFIAGFSLVSLGNAIDIGLLWLQHTKIVGPNVPAFLYKVYIALFFAGVIILCGGFLRGSFYSLLRYHRFLYYAVRIWRILAHTEAKSPNWLAVFLDPKNACYQGLILVRDFMALGGFILNSSELTLTHRADDLLTEFPLTNSS
ncbi:hypothetical protein IV500_17270 [Paeniglutamicibacter antarcticus]|uniref:Uncharacterized protein n=1 Tax=Arthrobacter terrae TaxID=2935737 RepID=A0A931CTH0_9MICC|nr:hypothetical protein [Arthrobacter terrae]MBG0741124.1 hypothetical protein [Arthrobacter terrae]